MRMGERTKRVLALLTAGAMVFTNTGMDVLASTSIVVGGITSGEDKKDETPAESESESETGTEQESESESETGSEAESEAAYTDQKVFTCEGDQATVTVTVPDEAQMPAGTELEVQPVVENSVTYDEIKNALTNEAQEVLGISAFHLAFITDGEAQIPSDIDYQVQIDYKDAVLAVAEGQEDSSVGAYVNQAGATADIQTSENGAVEAVSLSTKELGDVAVVRTGATAQERTYTYEDDEVIINVTVPAEVTLPQDAELVVKPVDEKTKEYKETVEKTEAEVEDYVLQHAVYDIGFQVNGEEVEPENGDIKVAFQFKQPVLNTEAITDGDADIDVKVLHVKDDGVEDTQANANVEADGSVKNVELVTDSFSPYDLVLLASELPEGNYGRVNFSYNDEKDAFRNSSYYVNTPLGLAGNFGVVAFDTANLTVDCNSNILAKKLIKVSNDWGTRHISGELSYVQEYKVSSTQPERSSNADNLSTLVVGSDVEVTGTIGQRFYMNGNTKEIETSKLNVIKDRNSKITPYIDLQKVEEEIKQISSTLAQQSNVGCTQKFIGEMNQRAITVTCGKGECAYYNTNLEELNERNSGGNPITIKGISNGASLVINIDCQSSSSNITIPAIDVEGASYQETTNFEYGRVILNLLNSAGKTITLSRAYASVIAPEATIIAKHSVNGSLIGRNVTTETENHRTTFTGTTTPAQAEVDGTKTVDGQTPTQEQKFTFVLEEKKGQEWGVVEEVQNEGKGITFKNLQYSKESDIGEHWYRVSEKVDKMSDYNTDTTQYIMKVTVTKTGDVYSAKKEYFEVTNPKTEEKQSVDKITFNNTTKKTELQIPVKKTAESDVWGNRTFEFELTAVDSAPMPEKNGSMVALSKPASGDTATGTFGKIEYKKTGIYQYKITEKAGNDSSVVYDNSEYIVTVEVKKNTDGELVASVTKIQKVKDGQTTDVAEVEFVNTEYTAAGSVTLEARKTLNGAAPGAGKFSFELKDKAGKILQTKANDGKGKVTFDPISYKLEDAGKEFTYTVSEVIPTDEAGVTYDKSVYTVTVKVTDNGNGTLGTKVSYQKGEEKVNGISFANTYAASGSVSLEASKTLNGAAPAAGKFSFELKDKAGKVLQTKANDGKGKVTFDPISYELKDAGKEFTYTVSEVIPTDKAGVTYDKSAYTVTVKVTDNGNGTLGTETSYQKGGEKVEEISFANTYYEEGKVNLKATKDFSGTTWQDETFQFVLTAGSADAGEVTTSPMPKDTVDGSKTVTVTKDNQKVAFGDIVYVNNGTYNYQIHEVNDKQAGITYDGAVWNVQVIVSNGQNGVKNVAIQYKKSTDETYTPWNDANDAFAVTFHNTYAEKGTARIQVAKEFNADEYPTGDDAFTFTLKAAPNEEGTTESPLPEQTTVKVTDANAVSFGDITFDTNGTYNYTVEENAGMLPNVIYDKTVYDVQIKVEDGGKADGVKKITVMSKKQADKEYAPLDGTVFTAAFSNIRYAVNVKKTDLTGVNEVKGATLTVYKASDINEDGTVKENAEKVTEFVSDGGANDISEELIRGEAYVLVETSAPEGYAFTNNIPFTLNEDGTVTVDKELQAEDGTILVKDALIGEQKVPLTATKTLTGAALTGDDFSFTLEEVKEDGTTELLQTKTNDAAGKVAFDDLTYDYKAEGKTFTYVVKETDTQKTGITYSKEAYTVKVVISKADTEGKMTAEVSYTDATGKAADAMNFTNTFAGSVSLVKVGPQQQKLAGAKFMLYQQQPSTDYKAYAETEYVTDANGNIKVEGLPEGNYYFVETTAPDGYVIKMNDDGTAKQYPFTIQAGKAEATVGVDIDLGLIENDTITPGEGGDIDLGSVTIEKSVLNAAGKTITADGTTFYAGVFSKNQDGTYTLVKSATLEQNGKVTIKDLTVGTYYLFETTKQGDRINEADFAFEITGNGQEFQIKSDENTDVKLVNKEKETVESEEETEKESEVKTETKTKKTTTVKTGDTTPIALYVGLLAAAAVLIALIVFLRKRKNK